MKLWLLSYFTTKIIAVSEAVKKCLVEYAWIDPKRIAVIYNSAPEIPPEKKETRSSVRKSLGIGDDDFVVGCIGRLIPIKGQKVLIDAIAQCRKDRLRCTCVIVGDGPEMENLRIRARAAGLEKEALLLGTRRDADRLLLAMDAFALPSLKLEGLPLVLTEAASAGLPLLATDIGGNAEIVKDGVNGYLVGVGDPRALAERIEALVKDPEKAKRLGENARTTWRGKFTQARMLGEIDALYKSVAIRDKR